MCACIEATSLKQGESIPLAKPRTIEIQGKMVGYDCILFWDIFPILSPMCPLHFPILAEALCHDPCPVPGAPALAFALYYYSVPMQNHPNMHEGTNHFLCFVDRTNITATQSIISMQWSGMQRAYFLYKCCNLKKIKAITFLMD